MLPLLVEPEITTFSTTETTKAAKKRKPSPSPPKLLLHLRSSNIFFLQSNFFSPSSRNLLHRNICNEKQKVFIFLHSKLLKALPHFFQRRLILNVFSEGAVQVVQRRAGRPGFETRSEQDLIFFNLLSSGSINPGPRLVK